MYIFHEVFRAKQLTLPWPAKDKATAKYKSMFHILQFPSTHTCWSWTIYHFNGVPVQYCEGLCDGARAVAC